MAVAIEISALNVTHGTGGPFGSAIFERCTITKTCRIAAVGANRVVPLGNSTLHGEMVAIQFAQAALQTFSLRQTSSTTASAAVAAGAAHHKEYVLYTSCEPCAMCLGGVLWSGISGAVWNQDSTKCTARPSRASIASVRCQGYNLQLLIVFLAIFSPNVYTLATAKKRFSIPWPTCCNPWRGLRMERSF
jgi:tRNA(Arg) A34 adenosine deaminase TadA